MFAGHVTTDAANGKYLALGMIVVEWFLLDGIYSKGRDPSIVVCCKFSLTAFSGTALSKPSYRYPASVGA